MKSASEAAEAFYFEKFGASGSFAEVAVTPADFIDVIADAFTKARREGAEAKTEQFKQFINAVEKLAFEMEPPNDYTPRFIQLVVAARLEPSED